MWQQMNIWSCLFCEKSGNSFTAIISIYATKFSALHRKPKNYTSNASQARVIEIIPEQHVPHDILCGSSHDDSYIQVDRTLQPYDTTSTPYNAGP
jgi:hypothetical protein